MPTLTITHHTEAQRLAYAPAIACVAEMHALRRNAPDGAVLDACGALTLSKGRDLLRQTPAGAAQARIDDVEERGSPSPPAAIGPETRGDGGVRP